MKPAKLLVTYMSADTRQLCANKVQEHHLNSVHGVHPNPQHRVLGSGLLPLAALNSMTLLGAEIAGWAYDVGMLKLRLKEADTLPVPAPNQNEATHKALSDVRPQLARHLGGGQRADAAGLIDEVLLTGELGMARAEVEALRQRHQELTARPIASGGAPRGESR